MAALAFVIGTARRFLGCEGIAMISVSEQRSLGDDRTGAGTLERQLESVTKRPDKAQFARNDQEERLDWIARTALPITSAGRFCPLGPVGIDCPCDPFKLWDKKHMAG
jgi:hypothetical protein